MQMYSRVVEAVLRVEDDEHALVELLEELIERVLQVHLPVVVVLLEVVKEVDEDVGVAFVDDAVGLLEQLVKLELRLGQQVCEKFWKRDRKLDVIPGQSHVCSACIKPHSGKNELITSGRPPPPPQKKKKKPQHFVAKGKKI